MFIETLRALYLGDNDFETIPSEIGQLKNLQIVSKLVEKVAYTSVFQFILKCIRDVIS